MFCYQVNEIVAVAEGSIPRQRFRIVEGYVTCDGARSRLTDRCFSDLAEAVYECKRLNETQTEV